MAYLSDIGGAAGSVAFIGTMFMSFFAENLFLNYILSKVYCTYDEDK
jgi:hypothetical protein